MYDQVLRTLVKNYLMLSLIWIQIETFYDSSLNLFKKLGINLVEAAMDVE